MAQAFSSIMIRRLLAEDTDAIFNILELVNASRKNPIGPTWTKLQIAAECHQSGLVGLIGAQIQSFILWRDVGSAWEIGLLATSPDAQGQGHMSRLVQSMIELRPQCQPIWLEVHTANQPARAFYEKAGFVQTGERKRYYADGGVAILYTFGDREG